MKAGPRLPAHGMPAAAFVPGPPPDGFDDRIDWFDRLCVALVHLEGPSLGELRRAVDAFAQSVLAHRSAVLTGGRGPSAPDGDPVAATLAADHARFAVSVEELRGYLRVVEGDDHGGHRQALGQYGRLLAEALRRHRAEERSGERASAAADPAALGPAPPGKR